jgi:hypothetical protein
MIRTIRTKPVSSTAQQARGGSCTGHLEGVGTKRLAGVLCRTSRFVSGTFRELVRHGPHCIMPKPAARERRGTAQSGCATPRRAGKDLAVYIDRWPAGP